LAKQLKYAELLGRTKSGWFQASESEKIKLHSLPFIRKVVGYRVYFFPDEDSNRIRRRLSRVLREITGSTEIRYHWKGVPASEKILDAIRNPDNFKKIRFGSDVAEQDEHLSKYFITTSSYRRCLANEKCLVIGPKGSGKTAILKTLQGESPGGSVVITPEVFATSVLSKFVESSHKVWDENEAFVSTWIFTILVEVFKRICDDPRGGKAKSLTPIRSFLRENSEYRDVDLFSRFILRLKTIESIKIGKFDLSIKTRRLQELYSLERLYSLIPGLRRTIRDDILVLIDELDLGWDNSVHANRFISALMQAALKVQNLGLRVHVIAFVRSEIFDIVKHSLDQLDKLRSGIEEIRWDTPQLQSLVLRRIAYSLKITDNNIKLATINDIFGRSIKGWASFDYIVSRTSRRPREVLQFVREAYQIAIDSNKTQLDSDCILKAEERFSGWKIEHICSEYRCIYPGLSEVLWAFRGKGPVLGMSDIDDIFNVVRPSIEELTEWSSNSIMDITQRLYEIEFLGAERPRPRKEIPGIVSRYEFSYDRPAASVRRSNSFLIHPSYWEVLEISD
jgi:energy-coupling factor transporter ATP-binding protein EcfA2